MGQDSKDKEYVVEVVNDRWVIKDKDDESCSILSTLLENPTGTGSPLHEKQTIIENCLFGVGC
ncbi:MAG: hypothetical protein IPK46_09015 [Saprospiraceae bacterium]|nr:hypothetical protein [Saprospiraceae bacterium]